VYILGSQKVYKRDQYYIGSITVTVLHSTVAVILLLTITVLSSTVIVILPI